MRFTLENLFRLDPQNMPPAVMWFVGALWILVAVICTTSISFQRTGRLLKVFWIFVVFSIPLVGVLLYCIFCLTKLDWKPIFGFLLTKRSTANEN